MGPIMREPLVLDEHDKLPAFELSADIVIDDDVIRTALYEHPVDLDDAKRYIELGPEMFPDTTPLEMLKGLVDAVAVDRSIDTFTGDLAKQVEEYKVAVLALVEKREAVYVAALVELRAQIAAVAAERDAAKELAEAHRRGAELARASMGPLQRVGAVADDLPIDPESDRVVNQALARRTRAAGTRKLTKKGPTK